MIWIEFNEDKILKLFIKHYKHCLLNIINIHFWGKLFKHDMFWGRILKPIFTK
jgi:uncharacterized membrane protein